MPRVSANNREHPLSPLHDPIVSPHRLISVTPRLDRRSLVREERALWRIEAPRIIHAVEHIRRMSGGSQSHLMRCSDGAYYVVKFQGNPQGSRILCNEMLATQIASCIGLPVPQYALVNVCPELIEGTDDLVVQLGRGRTPCSPGLSFGSRYLGALGRQTTMAESAVWDFLPDFLLHRIENAGSFAGMLAFDQWTCNSDGRQTAFLKRRKGRSFKAYMIDNGFCFGGADWTFRDSPLRGRYCRPAVYDLICGLDSVEIWVNRIENGLNLFGLEIMAGFIPPEWYEKDRKALIDLVRQIDQRRFLLRELLMSVRSHLPHLFRVSSLSPEGVRRAPRLMAEVSHESKKRFSVLPAIPNP